MTKLTIATTGVTLLAKLQANINRAVWPQVDFDFRTDANKVKFADEAEAKAFEAQLLEVTHPVSRKDERAFGDLCWRKFEEIHPDWTDKDLESAWWAGGGFFSLPTVECANKGTILFVAESQLERLAANPWVTSIWDASQKRDLFIGVHNIDELVVIPDEEIEAVQAD